MANDVKVIMANQEKREHTTCLISWQPDYDTEWPKRWLIINEDTPEAEVSAFLDACLRKTDARQDYFQLEDSAAEWSASFTLGEDRTIAELKDDIELFISERVTYWSRDEQAVADAAKAKAKA